MGKYFMRILRFDPSVANRITQFNSMGAFHLPISIIGSPARVDCFYLRPGGVVGMHPAVQQQLFLIVDGSGWVRAENTGHILIEAGHAALWNAGELHESGTEFGMTAIVLEGELLEIKLPGVPPLPEK